MSLGRQILIVIHFALLASAATAQTKPAISLNLSTVHTVIQAGSEIDLDILITNVSSKEILVSKSPARDNGDSRFDVSVRDANGVAAPQTDYSKALHGIQQHKDTGHKGAEVVMIPMGSNISVPLQPGDSMKDRIVLNRLYDLETPGTYSVQVSRYDQVSRTMVQSNTITIQVKR